MTSPLYYFAPLPAFLAYFLTSLTSFFAAPPFFGSAADGAEILLAASSFACRSF